MAYNDEVKLPAGRTTAKLSATGKAAATHLRSDRPQLTSHALDG